MADFIYQEPFPVGEDKTKYRLLTKEYVKVVECDGRKILKVDPKGLELLSKDPTAPMWSTLPPPPSSPPGSSGCAAVPVCPSHGGVSPP